MAQRIVREIHAFMREIHHEFLCSGLQSIITFNRFRGGFLETGRGACPTYFDFAGRIL